MNNTEARQWLDDAWAAAIEANEIQTDNDIDELTNSEVCL